MRFLLIFFIMILTGSSSNFFAQELVLTPYKAIELSKEHSLELMMEKNKNIVEREVANELTLVRNPEISFSMDSKVSREIGEKKMELNSISIEQEIPLFTFFAARKAQMADLSKAKYSDRVTEIIHNDSIQKLLLQAQYKKMILKLNKQRVETLEKLKQNQSKKVVYYLSKLDQKRIDIIKNESILKFEDSQAAFREEMLGLKNQLGISLEQKVTLEDMQVPKELKAPSLYFKALEQHPMIVSSQLAAESSLAHQNLASLQKYGNPKIALFKDKDFLADEKQTSYGVEVSLTLPLWGNQSSTVTQHKLDQILNQKKHDKLKEISNGRVKQLLMLLESERDREKNFKERILSSAKILLDERINEYLKGRSNLLILIDAYNSYFEYEQSYLEVLYSFNRHYLELQFYENY